MFSRDFLQQEYWDNQKSPAQIADENNTYPNAVRRSLLKYWSRLRDHSAAQTIVVQKIHPTKGKKLSDKHKQMIIEGMKKHRSLDGTT